MSRHPTSTQYEPNARRSRDSIVARCQRSLLASSVGWRLLLATIGIIGLWLMVHWAVAVS